MVFEDKIIEYFSSNLSRRIISANINSKLILEEKLIISNIGLPNNILDFQFIDEIKMISNFDIVIGKTSYESNIILNLKSHKITRDNDLFLSKSLKAFMIQLFVYDTLWKIDIPLERFGNYRENSNHKKYAKFLEEELLKIDKDLLKNDNGYFWGSLIEDIEFGIVG